MTLGSSASHSEPPARSHLVTYVVAYRMELLGIDRESRTSLREDGADQIKSLILFGHSLCSLLIAWLL